LYSIDLAVALGIGFERRPAPAALAAQRLSVIASGSREKSMGRWFLILGFLALAVGLLWIGQGTGVVAWPRSSFMVNQLQWAGYGALLGAVGLMLIWQGKP
jgi:hypothetical protein